MMPHPSLIMKEVGQPTIHGFSASVSVRCGCGNVTPLHLTFIAGLDLKATCNECGGFLWIAVLEYDHLKPNGMRIGVAYKPPEIVRPNKLIT